MAPAEAPLAPVDPKLGSAADSSLGNPADSSAGNNAGNTPSSGNNVGNTPSTVTDRAGAQRVQDPLTTILSGGVFYTNTNRGGTNQNNASTNTNRGAAAIISSVTNRNRGGAQRIG